MKLKKTTLLLTLLFLTLSAISLSLQQAQTQQSLHRKDKIKRLAACMKLSKQRQIEDKDFYNNLLSYVMEFSESQDKAGDFIALTIVTCYKRISDTRAIELLEAEKETILTKSEGNMDLLQLERYYEMYRSEQTDDVEEEILKSQEKILEVVSLSKEAEIMQLDYYNVVHNENNMDSDKKDSFLYVFFYVIFVNFFYTHSGFNYLNLIIVIIFSLLFMFIVFGKKRRSKKDNDTSNNDFSSYKKAGISGSKKIKNKFGKGSKGYSSNSSSK